MASKCLYQSNPPETACIALSTILAPYHASSSTSPIKFPELRAGIDSVEVASPFVYNEQTNEPNNGPERDVYGKSKYMQAFEQHLAELFKMKAATFVISGIQAQLIAIKVHAERVQRKKSVSAWHALSHLEIHEHESYKALLGMERVLIGDPARVPSFEDVALALESNPDISSVLLELPNRELGGECTPWSDLQRISTLCRERGVALHCDGARIWEAQPYYERSFAEIAALFDTVYCSFYKGLGALVGAILLGNQDFIDESRIWIRRLGGNLYNNLPYVISMHVNFNRRINTFTKRKQKMVEVVSAIRQGVPLANSYIRFQPEIPQTCMIHTYICFPAESGIDADRLLEIKKCAVDKSGIDPFRGVRSRSITMSVAKDITELCTEWSIGTHNYHMPNVWFVQGWQAFLEELEHQITSARVQLSA